mmetsp:Transcript_2466/g.9630  ORF Transcript_2466/g.9630 Transcript_2466/m.9630 type:complete len:257 (+) Transcript_2466:2702-3472(+)
MPGRKGTRTISCVVNGTSRASAGTAATQKSTSSKHANAASSSGTAVETSYPGSDANATTRNASFVRVRFVSFDGSEESKGLEIVVASSDASAFDTDARLVVVGASRSAPIGTEPRSSSFVSAFSSSFSPSSSRGSTSSGLAKSSYAAVSCVKDHFLASSNTPSVVTAMSATIFEQEAPSSKTSSSTATNTRLVSGALKDSAMSEDIARRVESAVDVSFSFSWLWSSFSNEKPKEKARGPPLPDAADACAASENKSS